MNAVIKNIVKSAVIVSTVLLTMNVANAAPVTQSQDVFVSGTIQGNWQADASAVSNVVPNVDKSVAVFVAMLAGNNPRALEATRSNIKSTELALQLFTRQFQQN